MFNKIRNLPYALAASATVFLMAEVANAQSNENIGQKAEQLKTQFGSLGKALVAGAFFIGIILVITGLIKLKAASENPNQAKYSDGLWRLAVGAGLIAIPAVTGILGASLGLGETKSITAAGGESF
jgi:anti-sigma factor RsiW